MKHLFIKSPAKINLYLDVLSKRKDGYHNLLTFFERISLFDKIYLKITDKEKGIKLCCNKKGIPCGSDNLAYKAAVLIREDFDITSGLRIDLVKNIPSGAGLGGASSNAAMTLLGLNRLYNLKLSRKKLFVYARKIGSDVNFFLLEKSFALAKDKGDVFLPIRGLKTDKIWHLLLIPKKKILTKNIYKTLNLKKNKSLTRSLKNVRLMTYALEKKDNSLLSRAIYNKLEEVTLKKLVEIGRIKYKLKALGVDCSLMSGSGPAVFGIVHTRKEALRLKREFIQIKDLDSFVVSTF
ncbi:MAG: 4-(cytidine 5'-diphospho)-2-C-methyl-D-erythritol kinase [Candidatus Gygaella obscura]|nr:4-(cytidine 5'-diphospho)-2-C-methyl-D-erythritol kinase [Candidatus Gygaella obscura]